MTGLHLASLCGYFDTVQVLLERGAPLEVRNVWGGTVLGNTLWAAIHRNPNVDYARIVEALIHAGAKVEPGFLEWWRQEMPLNLLRKQPIDELLRR